MFDENEMQDNDSILDLYGTIMNFLHPTTANDQSEKNIQCTKIYKTKIPKL